ncbi:DUF4176 domain-containing protein [Bacillus paralicheniformis]|nr:DUF4176 domain-containing protein [Bacillus paralicheniformis]
MFNEKKDEEHISEDWLPIGTVVKIKSVRKPVMVYGRNQIQSSSQKNSIMFQSHILKAILPKTTTYSLITI